MRFLLTGAGGPAGLSLARQLVERGHEAVGLDMAPVNSPYLTASALVPAASDARMIEALAGAVRSFGVDVLIPSVSDELPFVAAARDAGAFDVPVVIGPTPAVRVAHDKLATMEHLRQQHLSVPRFAPADHFLSADRAVEVFGGDVVVKPRVGRGSRGVNLVRSGQPNNAGWWAPSNVVQELAPGQEFAPMVYRSPITGHCVGGLVQKEQAPGSVGLEQETIAANEATATDVSRLATKVVQEMGLYGPVDLDVRRLADGTAVVLEVNARFGANSAFAPVLLDGVLDDLASGAVTWSPVNPRAGR